MCRLKTSEFILKNNGKVGSQITMAQRMTALIVNLNHCNLDITSHSLWFKEKQKQKKTKQLSKTPKENFNAVF